MEVALLDSDDLVAVGLVSIEGLLGLLRRDIAEVAVEPLVFVPGDSPEGGELTSSTVLQGR